MKEFEIIQNIQSHLVSTNQNLITGIGDDCAVLAKDEQNVFVVSTDALIENIHFDLKYFSFIELGKKAMAVNLSDIAAMGAKPLYAFISLGMPAKHKQSDISDLYTGMEHVAQEFSVAIAGGDLCKSPGPIFLNLTVVGEMPKEQVKLRSHAQAGDGIYVSGTIGSAAVGLTALTKKKKIELHYVHAIKNPRPRLYLANILAECKDVHAMIDLSDGLIQDLSHVMKASHTQASINVNSIPKEDDFTSTCKRLRLNTEQTLLGGGEDYQLLFTMNDNYLPELLKKLELRRNIKVSRIGSVYEKSDKNDFVTVLDDSLNKVKLDKMGFDHFS